MTKEMSASIHDNQSIKANCIISEAVKSKFGIISSRIFTAIWFNQKWANQRIF